MRLKCGCRSWLDKAVCQVTQDNSCPRGGGVSPAAALAGPPGRRPACPCGLGPSLAALDPQQPLGTTAQTPFTALNAQVAPRAGLPAGLPA